MDEIIVTRSLVFVNDIMFLCMLLLLRKSYFNGTVSNKNVFLAFAIFTLFCIFPFLTGDYLHFYESYLKAKFTSLPVNIESVYFTITDFASNYHIFRTCIWGTAALLLLFTFKFAKVNIALALLYFISRNIIVFSYARVSLSMAIMFMGLMLMGYLLESNSITKKPVGLTLAVFLILGSVYFHKSAVFGVGICLISYIMLKQNKFTIGLTIAMIPLIIMVIFTMVNSFMLMDMEDDELMLDVGQRYLAGNSSGYNSITKTIKDNIWRIPCYISSFLAIKSIRLGYFKRWPVTIRLCTNATMFCTLIATIFVLISFTLFYRFLNFAIIPSTIFIVYCHQQGLFKKGVKYYYSLSLLAVVIDFLYKTVFV